MLSPFRLSSFELLFLIFVLSTLGALAVPLTQQSTEAAKLSQCRSHLREIGVALHLYAEENDGRFPGDSFTFVRNTMVESNYGLLVKSQQGGHGQRDYLGRVHPLFCPSLSPLVYEIPGYEPPENISARVPIRRMGYVYRWSSSVFSNRTVLGSPDQPLVFDYGWAGAAHPMNIASHEEVLNVLHVGGHVTAFPLQEANGFSSIDDLFRAMRESASAAR